MLAVIASCNLGRTRITVHGEHVGTFMGIPPTGKRISLEIIEIIRVENGKIVERWNQRDWLGLFGQLGISPIGETQASEPVP